MPYTKTTWVNGVAPPISAANLNKLETQYDEALATVAITRVRKTADETVNNSDVLQNDNHLLFAVAANEVWELTINILALSATATPDLKANITVPAGATGALQWIGSTNYTETYAIGGLNPVFPLVATLGLFQLKAIVVNGANAGNVQFQWAQQTATVQNTTVKANSCIIAHKLA
uniref:Uncharacterized protein n=1 Tax=viral metagenome TaxID=1070528 RepID=A0A6M3IYH6_9ZZZZ